MGDVSKGKDGSSRINLDSPEEMVNIFGDFVIRSRFMTREEIAKLWPRLTDAKLDDLIKIMKE